MRITKNPISETEVVLTITAEAAELERYKRRALQNLSQTVHLPGFRSGKAPLSLVEKNVSTTSLQSEVLDAAINNMYRQAIEQERIRPAQQPRVELTNFEPYTELVFTATIPVIGTIKLADYKKARPAKEVPKTTEKEVDDVISTLQKRVATRNRVDRAAKDGDEVWISFEGFDAKGEAVPGAAGQDYPLILGSNTFIPGFEENMVGMKAGDQKEFPVTFPKDYAAAALQGKKVTFKVTVNKVQEIVEPTIDDAFAASAGPFKNVAELRDDIKRSLEFEGASRAEREFEQELLEDIVAHSDVVLPPSLIDEEAEGVLASERQRILQQGQTWEEHLADEQMNDEEHQEQRVKPEAARRLKAGVILTEIAETEGIAVTAEELGAYIEQLKQQYQTDKQMIEELGKPENLRELQGRILSQKTMAKLKEFAREKPEPKAKPKTTKK